MRIIGIGIAMVVLASAVMAAPIDPNMQDCFSDAVKEQQSEYKVCASDYRDAKIACTDDYLSCKWDYWMCIFSLPASVHTINCGAINLNCRMDYQECNSFAEMDRNQCVMGASWSAQMARHDCKEQAI